MVRRIIIDTTTNNYTNSNSVHRDFGRLDSDISMQDEEEALGSTTLVTANTTKRGRSTTMTNLTICTHTDDDCSNCQQCKRQKFAARKEEPTISLWEYDTDAVVVRNTSANHHHNKFDTDGDHVDHADDDDVDVDDMVGLYRMECDDILPFHVIDMSTSITDPTTTILVPTTQLSATAPPKVHFTFAGNSSSIIMKENDDGS